MSSDNCHFKGEIGLRNSFLRTVRTPSLGAEFLLPEDRDVSCGGGVQRLQSPSEQESIPVGAGMG